MLNEFRVISAGHTHQGKPLTIGETVLIRDDKAERFPHVFARAVAPTPAAGRQSRHAKASPDSSAPHTED